MTPQTPAQSNSALNGSTKTAPKAQYADATECEGTAEGGQDALQASGTSRRISCCTTFGSKILQNKFRSAKGINNYLSHRALRAFVSCKNLEPKQGSLPRLEGTIRALLGSTRGH